MMRAQLVFDDMIGFIAGAALAAMALAAAMHAEHGLAADAARLGAAAAGLGSAANSVARLSGDIIIGCIRA